MNDYVKETLRKQLQLLSERSKDHGADLPTLTHAMIEIASLIEQSEFVKP
ncbi:hypothetical protein [Faecalispora jeddahensis]|nr:hypothetical protein [Faecalispora jeddahensis]